MRRATAGGHKLTYDDSSRGQVVIPTILRVESIHSLIQAFLKLKKEEVTLDNASEHEDDESESDSVSEDDESGSTNKRRRVNIAIRYADLMTVAKTVAPSVDKCLGALGDISDEYGRENFNAIKDWLKQIVQKLPTLESLASECKDMTFEKEAFLKSPDGFRSKAHFGGSL